MMGRSIRTALLLGTFLIAGCARQTSSSVSGAGQAPTVATRDTTPRSTITPGSLSSPGADPFPSTYRPFPSRPTAIRNATILTAAGPAIRGGTIVMRDGKIEAVGANVAVPPDAAVIDGTGKYVTPGIIDPHAHVGITGAPTAEGSADGNEMSNPATAQLWIEHSVRPQDPQFPRALAAGVTTIQTLPGSANLIGGRTVVLKVVPSRTVRGMKFPGAKYGLKMACGENPPRVYANRGPGTRMANVAGWRTQFIQADAYRRRWDRWLADRRGDMPARDLAMETLADVLRGNIFVQWHCYTVQDMEGAMDVAEEFGFKIRAFHHAVEAYKIADLLAKTGIAAVAWSDVGGFKLEAIDAVRGNLALVAAAGGRPVVHSDETNMMQRLPIEAAKSIAAARAIGLDISEDEAIKWLTINPAWVLGLDDRIGSLEPGKNADVVLWSGNPFSIYTLAEKVWIDGAMLYDRLDTTNRWRTDFERGFVPPLTPATGDR